MALRTVLTTIVSSAFFFGGLLQSPAAIGAAAESVEFKLVNFSGPDSYPEYVRLDGEGRPTATRASLRCIENGYDGTAVWAYKELMVFDDRGPIVKRKEPRANVKEERGHRFVFRSFEECDKASPTSFQEGAVCTMKLKLVMSSKAKSATRAATFVSSGCSKPD